MANAGTIIISPLIPKTPIITTLAIQNGTDRTMYAVWDWKGLHNDKTDHYEIDWSYATGNGYWFPGGTDNNVTAKSYVFK